MVLSVLVAVLAVALGYFILNDVTSGGTAPTIAPIVVEATTTIPVDAIPIETTPTTLPYTAFKIQIANASKVAGSAGQLTTELQARGFIVQPALNSSEITPKLNSTVVYFLPGSEEAAAVVASALGGVATATMPTPIPTETGGLGEATILILLGTDLAGKPLPAAAAVTPVAPTATTVAPVGSETTTTVAG
jgi:hypothetical protein